MRKGLVIAVALLVGCSPKVIETVRTEYVYRDRVERDTTYVKDSIWVKEYVKGDTVRLLEYRDRIVFRDRYKTVHDTVAVHDSVAVERVKEVEKPLSAWKKVRLGAFWWLLAALAGCLAWIFRKPLVKLIKTII